MRLATNGVPRQCLVLLLFSILNQFRPQSLRNLPVPSLRSLRCLFDFYSLLPPLKILCRLINLTSQIALGSSLTWMLPSSHLTPVFQAFEVGFPESHCRKGSIKICAQIKSFKCLCAVLFLVLTTPIPTPFSLKHCLESHFPPGFSQSLSFVISPVYFFPHPSWLFLLCLSHSLCSHQS